MKVYFDGEKAYLNSKIAKNDSSDLQEIELDMRQLYYSIEGKSFKTFSDAYDYRREISSSDAIKESEIDLEQILK